MALTVTSRGNIWNTTAGNKSPTAFTPAVGDVLVVFCANSGRTTAQPPTVADNNSDGLGTYTKVGTDMTKNTSADSGWWFIRDAPIGSASSTTVTMTQSSDTGGGCQVWSVGPLSAGFTAAQRVGGKGVQNNQAAATPSITLDATPVSASAILGAVFTGTNGSANSAPPTSFSEAFDNGYNTPASGLEAVHRASGHTSTTVAWTAATPSAFGSSAIEVKSTQAISIGLLDASNALYAPTLLATYTLTPPLLDGGAALYAPSLVQVIAVPFLDASNALYAPSLSFASQSLTVPLLTSTSALYAPKVMYAGYPSALLAYNPTVYFIGDEPSGNLVDEIAGKVGTVVGSPTYGVAGPIAAWNALDLVGATDAVTIADHADLHLGNGPFTLIIWVKRHAIGAFVGLISSQSTNSPLLRIDNTDHLILTMAGVGNALADPATFTDTTGWHMVVVPWDNTSGGSKIILDGVDRGATFTSRTFLDPSATWYIGAESGGGSQDLNGAVAHVAIINGTALTVPQALALYQAAIQALVIGFLDAGPALYAPSILPAQFLTIPFLDASSALYAPTVTAGAAALTVPLLDAGNALYAPTLAPQAVTVSLGLLDAAGAVYAPTISTVNAVTVPLLDAGSALYAPEVQPDQFLTVPLLDAGPAVYAPALAALNLLTVPLLDAGAAVYAPSLQALNTLTPPLLDAAPALYAPSLAATYTLTPPLLDAGAALYAPTVYQDVFVDLPLLDGARALYDPVLTAQGGPQTLLVPLLDGGASLYAPTVIPGAIGVALGLLDAGNALYAPSLAVGPVWVTLPLLDAAPDVYAPLIEALSPASDIVLDLLDAGNALYAPDIAPGAVSVGLAFLDGLRALYAPVVEGGTRHRIAKGTRATVSAGGIVATVAVIGAPQDVTVEVEGRMEAEVS